MAYKVSSSIINAYLIMLASVYQSGGQTPEPERYFELWYIGIYYDLEKLEVLYSSLLGDLQRRLGQTKDVLIGTNDLSLDEKPSK